MDKIKIWLEPDIMRFGQPVIHYISKDTIGYWLNTCWGFKYPKYNGTCEAYEGRNSIRISEETFKALKVQSEENHKEFDTKQKDFQ